MNLIPVFIILECDGFKWDASKSRSRAVEGSIPRGLTISTPSDIFPAYIDDSFVDGTLKNGELYLRFRKISSRLCLSDDNLKSPSSTGRRRGGPGLRKSFMMAPGSLSSTKRLSESIWSRLSTGDIDPDLWPRPGESKLGSVECGGVSLGGPRADEGRPGGTNSPGSGLGFNPSSGFPFSISSSLLRLSSDNVNC